MEPLRAAVVGCGWIGSEVADDPLAAGVQAHAAAYVACSATELAGLCDADPARLQRAMRRWGTTHGFDDLGAMLAQVRPQIVSVCTPDATHAAVLRQVLASPDVRAVVAEKPLALDLNEARTLVELARDSGIVVAVNYIRRYAANHVEARQRIAKGEIGTVLAVHGLYTKGVMHNGTHWFDLARWLVGEIVSVQAWPRVSDPDRADPTCHVRVVFEDGQSGFLLGLDEEHFAAFEMDIVGSRGRLRVTESGMRLEWSSVVPSPHYTGYRMLQPLEQNSGGFSDVALYLVEDLVAALRYGRQPRCTARDALRALAIAQAARASLVTGEVQALAANT